MDPWICPRCGTVWAWWVAKCDCKPEQKVTDTTTAPWNDLSDDEEEVLKDAGVFPADLTGTHIVRCRCADKAEHTGVVCPIHDIRVTYAPGTVDTVWASTVCDHSTGACPACAPYLYE